MSKAKDPDLISPEFHRPSFFDSYSSKIEDFITLHGSSLLWSMVGFAFLLLVGYVITSGSQTKNQADFSQAESQFTVYTQSLLDPKADSTKAKEALLSLQSLIASHPELHQKYDGPLAQLVLIEGNPTVALSYEKDLLARTLENANNPFLKPYADYSRTSLLIAQGEFSTALQKALELQVILGASNSTHTQTLQLFNEVRIAMLYQQLGSASDELKAWGDVKQATGWNDRRLMSMQSFFSPSMMVLSHFHEGKISLLNYIEVREKELAPHGTL